MKYWFKILLVVFSTFKITAQSVGGIVTGGGICSRDFVIPGFISLSNYTGDILYWETSNNDGATWTHQSCNVNQFSYDSLYQTTLFRAIVQNLPSPPDTSTTAKVVIYNKFSMIGGGLFCVTAPSNTLQLSSPISQISNWEYSINGGNTWTSITNTLATQPYSNITQNTQYRAIGQYLPMCLADTSQIASFVISQNTIAGILQLSDTVCNGANYDTLFLSGQLGTITDWITSTNSGSSWNTSGNIISTYIYSNITQTTQYAGVVKNGSCPSDTTAPIKLVVVNANTVSAGPDKTITQYESVQLDGNGIGSPEWSPNIQLSSQNIFNPTASPVQNITYVLTLTNQYSCISKDSMDLSVIIPIPSAITPNGDGVNDYFLITKSDDFINNSLMIFNRWGNTVYKESPYKNTWNGKSNNGHDLPDEVYYYIFDYGNGEKSISGYILIKR